MRIAYIVNQYPTVSHTFIRREIQALEQLGHAIDRYSIRDTRGTLIDPADEEESRRTVCLLRYSACLSATARMVLTRPASLWKACSAAVALSRNAGGGLARHLAYVVEACHLFVRLPGEVAHVHAHFGTNSTTVAMLCHLLGGPEYSFTVHGPEEFDRPAAESLAAKVARAKFVVAISSFGKSQLQRICPAEDWGKIHIVRCGLDDAFSVRATTPIPNTRRLVCVARLSPQKGLLTLLDAAARLAQSGEDFELILVGDGPLRTELENRIASAGLKDRVRLVGSQTGAQVRNWLETSRCFVLPSFAEGLPVVIMEAFALARPVISTYVAGIPELVSPGQNGWLVPAGSVDDLAAAMREALAAETEELDRMGQLGREQVLKFHSASKEAERLADLFNTSASRR